MNELAVFSLIASNILCFYLLSRANKRIDGLRYVLDEVLTSHGQTIEAQVKTVKIMNQWQKNVIEMEQAVSSLSQLELLIKESVKAQIKQDLDSRFQ
jgi:16S rRNA G527 N7-methylase RsmG